VIKNLVYASLILFYNLLLQTFAKMSETKLEVSSRKSQEQRVKGLIDCLNTHIMEEFSDHTIVNVVLHLITLFTKNVETAKILFANPKILAYIFKKLKHDDDGGDDQKLPPLHVQETIKLATLALSRLSSKFDLAAVSSAHFKEQLREFDNFKFMISYIKRGIDKNAIH